MNKKNIRFEQVINLVGPTSQQDVELSALYRDAVITYGEGKVLGILATKTGDHEIRKRAATEETNKETQSTTTSSTPDAEQNNQTDFIYYPSDPKSSNKILMYTDSPPTLFDGTKTIELDNKVPTTITTNKRSINDFSEQRALKVQYNFKDKVCLKLNSMKIFVFFLTNLTRCSNERLAFGLIV